MTRNLVRRTTVVGSTVVLLAATGVPAALAGPADPGGGTAPVYPPPPATDEGTSFGTQIHWMLGGAAVTLALVALIAIFVLVLEHRHARRHRLATT